MIERRTFLTGATALSAAGAGAATPEMASAGHAALDETAELRQIRDELQLLRQWAQNLHDEVDAVREQQRIFLKATQKYPDFIDVGLAVWERLYDWHVRWQQPLNLSRLPDGQYGMTFMLTTLVLRPNMQASYIGPGYDSK